MLGEVDGRVIRVSVRATRKARSPYIRHCWILCRGSTRSFRIVADIRPALPDVGNGGILSRDAAHRVSNVAIPRLHRPTTLTICIPILPVTLVLLVLLLFLAVTISAPRPLLLPIPSIPTRRPIPPSLTLPFPLTAPSIPVVAFTPPRHLIRHTRVPHQLRRHRHIISGVSRSGEVTRSDRRRSGVGIRRSRGGGVA